LSKGNRRYCIARKILQRQGPATGNFFLSRTKKTAKPYNPSRIQDIENRQQKITEALT